MAITTALCTSFKKQLFEAAHDFRSASGDTIKLALYTSSATLGASTLDYTTTNEVTGGGYPAGGGNLTRIDPASSGVVAFLDFGDLTFATVTITARGCLIYNASPTHTYTNPSVSVHDFGTDKTVSGGDFVVVFPTADATNAIIRLA